jgi:hypothetical protein
MRERPWPFDIAARKADSITSSLLPVCFMVKYIMKRVYPKRCFEGGAMMDVKQVDPAARDVSRSTSKQGQLNSDTERFSKLYRETEIKLEIAARASKLPSPNVSVNPKAISRMAQDAAFYKKVMDKINAFTSDPNITLNYPHITYSLAVDEDGGWVETMVNEDLKKQSEEAAEHEDDNASVFDMLEPKSPLPVQPQYDPPVDIVYDYSSVSVGFKKRNLLKTDEA